MKTSEQIDKLAEALAQAQGEFPAITRNRTVTVRSDKGNYTFEYATLDHILELTKPARTKYGLALSWGCRTEAGELFIAGRLMHSSGQWVESCLPVPKDQMLKPQLMGSALTYRKRYLADELLGLSASEDDDANAEEGNQASFKPREAGKKAPGRAAGEPEAAKVERESFPEATPPVATSKAPSLQELTKATAENRKKAPVVVSDPLTGKPGEKPAPGPLSPVGFGNALQACSTEAQLNGLVNQIRTTFPEPTLQKKLLAYADLHRLRLMLKPEVWHEQLDVVGGSMTAPWMGLGADGLHRLNVLAQEAQKVAAEVAT